MLALEKWGQGRFEPLVIFSQTVAIAAESTYELCVAGRSATFREKLARVEDRRRWLSNYRNCGPLLMLDIGISQEFLTATYGKKRAGELVDSLGFAHDWLSMTAHQRKLVCKEIGKLFSEHKVTWADLINEIRDVEKSNRKSYRKHLTDIENEIRGKANHGTRVLDLVTKSQEMRFFLLVSVPCWIEHGISPGHLFRQARLGDFDSMRKLLSIDSYCTEDVRLARQRIRLLEESNDVRRRMLTSAEALEPLRNLTRANVKILLAALVHKTWADFDAKAMQFQKWLWRKEITVIRARRAQLSYPAVQALFDAAFKDTHKHGLADPDLTKKPDAFRKIIGRYVERWSQLPS